MSRRQQFQRTHFFKCSFPILITAITSDELRSGRIVSGRVNVGDSIVCIHRNGERERATVTTLFTYSGLEQVEIKHASAGDIIGLTGFEEIFIGETLTRSRGTGTVAICGH